MDGSTFSLPCSNGQGAGRKLALPAGPNFARGLLIEETRAAIRSNLRFKFFDFKADDLGFDFGIHCLCSFR